MARRTSRRRSSRRRTSRRRRPRRRTTRRNTRRRSSKRLAYVLYRTPSGQSKLRRLPENSLQKWKDKVRGRGYRTRGTVRAKSVDAAANLVFGKGNYTKQKGGIRTKRKSTRRARAGAPRRAARRTTRRRRSAARRRTSRRRASRRR